MYFHFGGNHSLGIKNSLPNSCDLESLLKKSLYIYIYLPNTGDEREELETFYYYNVPALPVKWYSVI